MGSVLWTELYCTQWTVHLIGFDRKILARGKCFWSWFLVRRCIDASSSSVILFRILGRRKVWISLKFANQVQICRDHNLKYLNWSTGYFWRCWLGVLRTICGNLLGVISQGERILPLQFTRGPENWQNLFWKNLNRIKIGRRLKVAGIWSLARSHVGEGFLGRRYF